MRRSERRRSVRSGPAAEPADADPRPMRRLAHDPMEHGVHTQVDSGVRVQDQADGGHERCEQAEQADQQGGRQKEGEEDVESSVCVHAGKIASGSKAPRRLLGRWRRLVTNLTRDPHPSKVVSGFEDAA